MSLMRNSLVASGAIFACRLTGMAREIVYTSLFGATGDRKSTRLNSSHAK